MLCLNSTNKSDGKFANYPTYLAQKTLVIPIINIPQVQPSLTVDVLADPEDKYNEDRIGLILK